MPLHTIQITVNDGDDFILDNEKFILKQFHFHTPSENHIFDKSYPLEAHFVHANSDGEVAVIAVMFDIGKENSTLNTILQAVPEKVDDSQPLKKTIDLAPLFPEDKSYYRFSGSLTTPPCSEGLSWLVIKQPLTLSEKQLNKFTKILKHTNNRPIQPLRGRVIVE
ncbi:MAG: Carbonic anhydrase [Candidatus Erwinia impunctatus]